MARIPHPLPAPVVHAGFSVSQSKSHVLAGVQDAYWSDDDAEDAECPLCLEEMDISDLNFKPCVCGYQICRFCWHHIKENLNKRCPACRRVYTDDAVEFKAIATQDHKRLTQQKKQRDRERKELDALGRRQLANVRVVQRNVVYVVGIGSQFAKEELIPTLRSNEYFGQYGKITKILLVKRTPSGGGTPVVGLYITYHRKEDAARAIAAVDGTASPGGGRDVMRASYGTTKYCMAFLRGVSCSDHSCMNLHAWGDEKDCFTKEDLTTLKHTMKATESRSRKKGEEADGLPRAAAWGHKPVVPAPAPSVPVAAPNPASSSTANRQARRTAGTRQPRNTETRTPTTRAGHDRKNGSIAKSQASTSRPSTPAGPNLPARPPSPVEVKPARQKRESLPKPSQSPAPSATADSEGDSQDASPTSPDIRPQSTDPASSVPSAPPGLPAFPPGLSAPPGISLPGRPPRPDTASPQTPLLASQTLYQMSNAARALLDDVKARREAPPLNSPLSPFPDLDRTLQALSGADGGGFSFNLDQKLAGDDATSESLPDFDLEARTPFMGTFMDAFPAVRAPPPPGFAPPGLAYPHNPSRSIYDPLATRPSKMGSMDTQSSSSSSYAGSFNPFGEGGEEAQQSRQGSIDDESSRKVSRFGFARGRQGSATSSPLHVASALSVSTSNADTNHLYNSNESTHSPAQSHWSLQGYQQPGSNMASPLVSHAQANLMPSNYVPAQSRFHPFDSGVSEAQLRDFIQSSRERESSYNAVRNNSTDHQAPFKIQSHQQFTDPAIMSARLASMPETGYAPVDQQQMSFGPPPGLVYPQNGVMPDSSAHGETVYRVSAFLVRNFYLSPTEPTTGPRLLSSMDFPALAAPSEPTAKEEPLVDSPVLSLDLKAQEKADRRALKQAAAAEKAAERQKIAQERATAKAAERAKVAQEKAVEREKAAALKAQQEQEKLEKEKRDKEREKALREKERERLAKVEKEKQVQLEKEKERIEKEKTTKKQAAAKLAETQKTKGTAKTPTRPVAPVVPEPPTQAPLMSKKPKKNKPITKPLRIAKEDFHAHDDPSSIPSAVGSDVPHGTRTNTVTESGSNNSRAQSVERDGPTTVAELLEDLHISNPSLDLLNHPIFDLNKVNPAAKMPLEYGPLVHALSALSVGGGSFANNVPSGSIDNAVSSFQQLLETLTQTISDLLRLLPRTTWDDSSSFDGVLRDMLKGDDFLDDGADDGNGKEDEVAALTLALERRARWMEVQLSKLEELHRDINTAAVKAVLAFNDNGWDHHGFLPRVGNTLKRFETLGLVQEKGVTRAMTAEELEKRFVVAKEAAVFAETEVKEAMERMQALQPMDID
ncbi:hypothetical protein C8J56DRAFT_833364 [Mycena floridula]|nr:hypothetical protein C8J56DRAFT_833364 [Mycena floridula]